jgi:hypothetical protein
MKIIFLDIDGVLNCQKTTERFHGFVSIDPKLVKRLNRILKETDAKIVLSSTWRLFEDNKEILEKTGIKYIDVTPSFHGLRGEEINDWLSKHPEVDRYVILDDDSDMLPNQILFQTTWNDGLTLKIMHEVIKYLNMDLKKCLKCGKILKQVKK